MSKKFNKGIALALTLAMIISCPCFVSADETPKTIEYNFSSDGTLSFTGTGTLDNSYTQTISNIESIKSVKIGAGITAIAANTFASCSNLTKAEIPYTVKTIGANAFKGVADSFVASVHEDSAAVSCFDSAHRKIVNHNLSTGDFLWSSNCKKCAVNFNCSVCAKEDILRWCTVTSKVSVPATCKEKGTTEYTATFNTASDKKTVQDIALVDHQWDTEYTVDEEANCTNGGVKSIHCKVCDVKKEGSEVVVPKEDGAHVVVTVYKAPANYKMGETYDKCEVCNKRLTPITPIPYNSKNFVKNFKVSAGAGSFTAKWTKQTSTKFDGYVITYSKYKSMKNSNYVYVSRKASSKKVAKLTKGKKYYVEICSYEIYKGSYYFSKNTTATVTIK